MRDIIDIIKTHAEETRLSHYDAFKARNSIDININDF
jgi:hypothetical protein